MTRPSWIVGRARTRSPVSKRHRVSPLLTFYPSEFSRLRLQYNYDRFDHARESAAHSVWLGLEFALGSHPAHEF